MSLTKDEREFALEEFKTLREEVAKKSENHYKLLSLGTGGIAALIGVAFQYEALFIVLPLMIIAFNYLYITETRAIIHTGCYLKKLEEKIYREYNTANAPDKMGWESYVKRKVYKSYDNIASIIFIGFFIISCLQAFIYMKQHASQFLQNIGLGSSNGLIYTLLITYLLGLTGIYLFMLIKYRNKQAKIA